MVNLFDFVNNNYTIIGKGKKGSGDNKEEAAAPKPTPQEVRFNFMYNILFYLLFIYNL